ncbi:MAG: hypothetical protein GF317_23760 [Candidatus Lokiarchaeota archaeon]|nr:hypothetical protein [Candidatus Lokiarchaeota archaeon]MBD3202386.1 hypothetical protein [Candidatus Lokiarchaeota archaeon]
MDLTTFQIIQGSFSLFFIVVAVVIAAFIIQRYIQYKSIEHLYVGLAWLGLAGPWFSDAIVFPTILIGNLINPTLTSADYLSITIAVSLITTYYIPIAILFWLFAFTKLLGSENRKLIMIIFTLINLVFEVLFVFFTFYDLSYIGTYKGPFTYQWGLLTTIFYLTAIFTALISGLLFANKALKTDAKESRLKGKFLIISFVLFTIGSIIPYVWFDIIGLVLSRLILVTCVITFYFGLNMPKFVKELIIK